VVQRHLLWCYAERCSIGGQGETLDAAFSFAGDLLYRQDVMQSITACLCDRNYFSIAMPRLTVRRRSAFWLRSIHCPSSRARYGCHTNSLFNQRYSIADRQILQHRYAASIKGEGWYTARCLIRNALYPERTEPMRGKI
jgi:hypothetical protein